jgi:DNA-binding NtrC family response regulator
MVLGTLISRDFPVLTEHDQTRHMALIIYTDSDYEGRFNLKKAERDLIIKASIKAEGNRKKMSILLEISMTTLSSKITAHGLDEQLSKSREKENP